MEEKAKEIIEKDNQADVAIRWLNMIICDMENDARELDGKPFDGKTVATYFGYQGAAISTLAKIMKEMLMSKSV